jgi:PAS domain-containing protein
LVLNARKIDTTTAILIVIEDVTERKLGQEELERNESTIRALLQSATQSIIAVDSDEKIVLVNGSMEKMFGYTRDAARPGHGTRIALEVPLPASSL